MQTRDNKWGIPEEVAVWLAPLAIIALIVGLMLPVLNRTLKGSKARDLDKATMSETNSVPENKVNKDADDLP